MATTAGTTTAGTATSSRGVERNSRRTRWLHATVYLTTFVLLGTGWWLWLGKEGESSVLSNVLGASDVDIHKLTGWALAGVGFIATIWNLRASGRFVLESVRFRDSDLTWFAGWPGSVFTGRFARHRGHFDPGQRLANLVMIGGLVVLVGSGFGLIAVHGGTAFVWLHRVHRWATYIVTPVIAGHVIVALGILPGYRGVWRAMHGRGLVSERTARRLWPEWAEKMLEGRSK